MQFTGLKDKSFNSFQKQQVNKRSDCLEPVYLKVKVSIPFKNNKSINNSNGFSIKKCFQVSIPFKNNKSINFGEAIEVKLVPKFQFLSKTTSQ